jgi:pilus assembly protein CpaE
MDSLILALIVPDGPLKAWLSAALEPLPVRVFFETWLPTDWTEFLDRLARLDVAAVLVDADRFGTDLPDIAARIKTVRPPVPAIVAVTAKTDPAFEAQARAAGADDVIRPPFERNLGPVLEKIANQRSHSGADSHSPGALIGVMGVRGGCGTTTFACLLALALRRVTAQPVLLADMDWNAGGVGFLMTAQTPYSLLDAATATHRLDRNYWKTLIASHSSGVDVIPAPPEPPPADPVAVARIPAVLRFARSLYSYVVADMGECWDNRFSVLGQELDRCWLVATPDALSLYQARRALRWLAEAGINPQRTHLLVNRAGRAALTPEDLESLIGKRPVAWLPESAELRAAGNGERQLDLRGRTGERVVRLAAHLVGKTEADVSAILSLPALRIARRAKFPSLLPRL